MASGTSTDSHFDLPPASLLFHFNKANDAKARSDISADDFDFSAGKINYWILDLDDDMDYLSNNRGNGMETE
jgi:hypothetical protein